MTKAEALKQARKAVGTEQFGTDAWESAMEVVRKLVDEMAAERPVEEFCSIDSGGLYRTRLLSGRIV